MITSIFNLFKNGEYADWEGKKNTGQKHDPLSDIKTQIAAHIKTGWAYRQVFINQSVMSQINASDSEPYWEKPETDIALMYQAIQAATEMGYYFTVVSPKPWKHVLLVDIRQIPLRYIQAEWSDNKDWSGMQH